MYAVTGDGSLPEGRFLLAAKERLAKKTAGARCAPPSVPEPALPETAVRRGRACPARSLAIATYLSFAGVLTTPLPSATAHLRGGLGAGRPTSNCRLTTHTKQKAGANISFAPAVLLLRSHSLITLFVIFRTVSASSWESSYLYANFDCPFKTLTNCSLDLPSGSLFAQKHLWNGVMFVIKIVLGVMGLMPRTKAS